MKTKKLKLKAGEALVLRTCNPDGTSYGGFQWPKSGPVVCPDWKPRAQCGNGLHGLLHGVGDGGYLEWGEAAWLVVKVLLSEVVDIEGKVKFPKGEVVYFGERFAAVALIAEHAPAGSAIVSGTATAGDSGTATAGDSGTATAGYRGTATAGYRGTATAGYSGTATAGVEGCISILYWNGEKYKRAVFLVGENGIKPNTPYSLDESGAPVEVVKEAK